MNDSNGFQTGGIVLLAMSIVFCGLAFSLVLPMINGANQPSPFTSSAAASTEVAVGPNVTEAYAGFYPPANNSAPSAAALDSHVTHSRMAEQASFTNLDSEWAISSPPVAQSTNPGPAAPGNVSSRQQGFSSNPCYATVPEVPTTTSTHRTSTQSFGVKGTADPQYESTIVTNETFETVETIETSAEEQSTPAKYSPDQMPGGSVYAPITVNLDSSIFAEQTRLLEQQLRDYRAESEAKTQAIAKQANEARQRQRDEIIRGNNDHRDKELAKISQNFEELVKSFRELQHQTHQSLQQVSSHVEDRQMAAELIESYKRSLQVEEDRRKEILDASRVAVALEIQKFANEQQQLIQREARQQRILQTQVPVPDTVSKSRTQVAQAPRDEEVPRPDSVIVVPQPMPLPPQPTSSFVSPGSTIRMQASSISRPRVISSPKPNSDPLLPPRINEDTTPVKHKSAATREHSGMQKSDFKSVGDSAVLPNLDDEKPLEVTSPQWELMDIDQETELHPLRVPTQQESASLKPVRELQDRRAVTPVAYSSTYKFTMEVNPEGEPRVVPAPISSGRTADNVTERVASVRSEVQQASAETRTAACSAEYCVNSPSKSTTTAEPTRDLRRDTKNAARGMNRNFGAVSPEVGGEDRKPWLQLRVPSLTMEEDEPGLLHRMSSAVRQMGRSIR